MSPSPSPTVLVVDDYDANRVLLQDVLELEGFHVIGAKGGEEALEFLRLMRPSLILLDVRMPGVDGRQLLERMHADVSLSSIPVVLVTADRDAARIGGVAGLIRKPFDVGALVDTVRRCATDGL